MTTRADDYGAIRLARASAGTGVVDGRVVEKGLRCTACGKRLAEYAAAPFHFRCPRCKASLKSAPSA